MSNFHINDTVKIVRIKKSIHNKNNATKITKLYGFNLILLVTNNV